MNEFDQGATDQRDVDQREPDQHPRFRERRAAVEDQSLRSRNRKLIAAGVVILAILLAAASTQSALFDVDEVRIVGAQRATPEELRAVAAVELGTPILGLDTDAVTERLIALPLVATATVSTSWSGVVTVEVDERVPVARIDSTEGMIIVASDGMVLNLFNDPEAELPPAALLMPEIRGAIFSTDAGERVPEVLDDALALATALPDDIGSLTERIEITVDSLVVRVAGGGQIAIGDARDLDKKFDAIRAFIDQVDLKCLNTMDVRAPSVPVIMRNESC